MQVIALSSLIRTQLKGLQLVHNDASRGRDVSVWASQLPTLDSLESLRIEGPVMSAAASRHLAVSIGPNFPSLRRLHLVRSNHLHYEFEHWRSICLHSESS